eukprot:Hpha_TRINITY_DN7925_c0_g1::TRINITY_DN7925_c0_g1_i1::g.146142::m.146142
MPWSDVLWRNAISSNFHYDDPAQATFQRYRETRAWYVCPRNPFIDGVTFNLAPFFDNKGRRVGDSPARWIWGGMTAGLCVGLGNAMAANTDMFSGLSSKKVLDKNWNVRRNHGWAMRRLFILRITRPLIGVTGVACAYWIPREFFSQAFGRRNKFGSTDIMPHLVGCTSLFLLCRPVVGALQARLMFHWAFWAAAVYEWLYSKGQTPGQYHREFVWPQQMAHRYGLPNGGEGFDNIEGGEMSTTYRLESDAVAPFLRFKRFKIRNLVDSENHPVHRFDWGHSPMFS